MNLSVLETRLMEKLPAKEETIAREFAKFESEIAGMSDDDDKVGQARLTSHEIATLPMGNQHTQWNVIRWQCIKAVALDYGVTDWTSKVDPELTYEENMEIMKGLGTRKNNTTMRERVQR